MFNDNDNEGFCLCKTSGRCVSRGYAMANAKTTNMSVTVTIDKEIVKGILHIDSKKYKQLIQKKTSIHDIGELTELILVCKNFLSLNILQRFGLSILFKSTCLKNTISLVNRIFIPSTSQEISRKPNYENDNTSFRCHPDCKSRVVLDSICTSCHAMKECLRNDREFEQYFDEEDFETAHWPCERCLDALKSIKMLWKVILERIFKIAIPRSEGFESSSSSKESVKTVTKAWQDEMVQQTLVVKNLTPYFNDRVNAKSSNGKSTPKDIKKESILSNCRKPEPEPQNSEESLIQIEINTLRNYKHKSTDTDDLLYRNLPGSCQSLRKKLSRSSSLKVRTIDVGCEACYRNDEELNIYKNNLDYLQQRFNVQSDELKRLKSENISIKLDLRHMLRSKRMSTAYTPMIIADDNISVIPKPFESCCSQQENESIKNADSEIIITLKNCQNEKFRKVSFLQVLHKTNEGYDDEIIDNKFCNKNEDPMTILSKVHDRFGAIVKREMRIANKKQLSKMSSEKIDIKASFHKMSTCVSNPSCSRIASQSSLNDSVFASTTNVL